MDVPEIPPEQMLPSARIGQITLMSARLEHTAFEILAGMAFDDQTSASIVLAGLPVSKLVERIGKLDAHWRNLDGSARWPLAGEFVRLAQNAIRLRNQLVHDVEDAFSTVEDPLMVRARSGYLNRYPVDPDMVEQVWAVVVAANKAGWELYRHILRERQDKSAGRLAHLMAVWPEPDGGWPE